MSIMEKDYSSYYVWAILLMMGLGAGAGVIKYHYNNQEENEVQGTFEAMESMRRSTDPEELPTLPGREMHYSEHPFGALPARSEIGFSRRMSKSQYVAGQSRPMLKKGMMVHLEDMGVGNVSGRESITGIEPGKELSGFIPSTEEEMILKAAKKRRKKSPTALRREIQKIAHFGGASGQLKAASYIASIAASTRDEDAQLALAGAITTGADITQAMEKVREESNPIVQKPEQGMVGRLLGALNSGWSHLFSKKPAATTNFEVIDQEKTCEMCGTVSWEGVLSGPGVGAPAPSAGSPYSVELNPAQKHAALSLSELQEVKR